MNMFSPCLMNVGFVSKSDKRGQDFHLWSREYLLSIGCSDDAIDRFWDRRFTSARMEQQIRNTTYAAKSRFAGSGCFAVRRIKKSTIIGYYTGPVLNSETALIANTNYVSYVRWRHPDTQKVRSYYIEVVSPSKLMNAGIHPQYLGNSSKHSMRANAELGQSIMKINGRYRPILFLKTIYTVKKDEELLLDYGVLYDSIYFEYLRKKSNSPSILLESIFQKNMQQSYRRWLKKFKFNKKQDVTKDQDFLEFVAKYYFNKLPDEFEILAI